MYNNKEKEWKFGNNHKNRELVVWQHDGLVGSIREYRKKKKRRVKERRKGPFIWLNRWLIEEEYKV